MSATRLTIFSVLVFLFASCGPRIVGYAVVVWPDPEQPFAAGQILDIVQTSQLQGTVTALVDQREVSYPMWRVEYFETEPSARSFSENFDPWRESYARSLLTALPVRALPDRTSPRLYRLRDGEVMKVIGRQDEQSNEAGLVDYWYRVLTENGTGGWVFGRNLELVSSSGRSLSPRDDMDRLDRLVRDIRSVTWRPAYFSDMLRTGRISLERFDPRFGLFGDEEENRFRMVLPGLERTFEYTGYSMPAPNTVQFEGASLTLVRHSEERLEVQYLLDNRQRSSNFVLLDRDLQEVVQNERVRRADLLRQILLRGNALVSTAFGSMRLDDRGTINWQGYQRLVPSVIPIAFNGTGTMRFSLFIADDLRARFDGAFRIDYAGGGTMAFLYTITDDGLRMVYVPERLISDQALVREEPTSPVILFFRFVSE